MKTINFEGLGLSFNINSVLIDFNGIKIYWYAVCIVFGIILCLLFCKKDDGKYNIKFDDILLLALFLFPISIIGARLYYVLFNLDYFSNHLNEIIDIKSGGLAIYGGIIGAILTIIVFCKIKKLKILDVLDYLAPYLALGQAVGRWGNFFNCEAHGTETTTLFRMGIVENGQYIEVHPTFLYESIATFLIFLFLFIRRNKPNYEGEQTYLYFALYGLVRAVIEGLRTDSLMLGNIRISQVLSIILCVICSSILIYKKVKRNKGK